MPEILTQLFNALAFANIDNLHEFQQLLEHRSQQPDDVATATPQPTPVAAPVIFCVVPNRIATQ